MQVEKLVSGIFPAWPKNAHFLIIMKVMVQCCNSCGFLLCNREKPSSSGQDWYADANIERLWHEGLKQGNFLICHSTDPDADRYGGVRKRNSKQHTACLGAVYLVYMHIKVLEHFDTSYKRYRDAVGHKVAMTKAGLISAASDIAARNAGIFRSLKIPQFFEEERPLRLPAGFDKVKKIFENLPV